MAGEAGRPSRRSRAMRAAFNSAATVMPAVSGVSLSSGSGERPTRTRFG